LENIAEPGFGVLYFLCGNRIKHGNRSLVMYFVFFDLEGIIKFIQANGYKDFMTGFILVVVIVSFGAYLYGFIRKEIKKDKKKHK